MIINSLIVTVWGVRLAHYLADRMKYGFKTWLGEEDARWKALRERPVFKDPIKWLIFEIAFVSIYQHQMAFAFAMPMVHCLNQKAGPLGLLDFVIAAFMLFFIGVQTITDRQYYSFRKEKLRKIEAGETLEGEFKDGFIQSGLFAYARHPNYTAEILIWFCHYLFGAVATGDYLNWTFCGPLLLIILFKGTTSATEKHNLGKYPKYKEYCKKVPKVFPNI